MAAPEIAVLVRTCKHSEIDITSRKNGKPDKFGYALKCDNIAISYTKTPIQVPIPQQSPQLIDIGVYRPSVSTSGVVDTIGGSTPIVTVTTQLNEPLDDSEVGIDLDSSVGSGATNISVGDVIRIDNEDMDVTAKSGHTLTVVRGINGTASVLHLDNTAVYGYGPAFFEGMSSFNYTRTTGYGGHASAKPYYLPYKNSLEDFVTQFVYSTRTPLEIEWGDASFPMGTGQTGGAIYLVAIQQMRFQVDASKEDRYTFSCQFVVTARKDKV